MTWLETNAEGNEDNDPEKKLKPIVQYIAVQVSNLKIKTWQSSQDKLVFSFLLKQCKKMLSHYYAGKVDPHMKERHGKGGWWWRWSETFKSVWVSQLRTRWWRETLDSATRLSQLLPSFKDPLVSHSSHPGIFNSKCITDFSSTFYYSMF